MLSSRVPRITPALRVNLLRLRCKGCFSVFLLFSLGSPVSVLLPGDSACVISAFGCDRRCFRRSKVGDPGIEWLGAIERFHNPSNKVKGAYPAARRPTGTHQHPFRRTHRKTGPNHPISHQTDRLASVLTIKTFFRVERNRKLSFDVYIANDASGCTRTVSCVYGRDISLTRRFKIDRYVSLSIERQLFRKTL